MTDENTKNEKQEPSIIGGKAKVAPRKRFWTGGKIVFFLLIFTILGGSAYYGYTQYGPESEELAEIPTYVMRPTKMEITVIEQGTLKSLRSQPIKAEFGDRCKIEWIVPEETKVKKGDEVLRFDTQELQKQIDDYEVRLKENESELVRAKEDDVIAQREDEATLINAEKNIVTAREELEKFLNSDVPRKKKQYKVDIRQARQALREIEADVAALPFLIEKELKTLNDLENAKIQLENRKNALRNKEEDYRIYLEYTLPRQLAEKREAVENAIRNLERTKNNISSKQAQRQSSIRRRERELENTKKRLDSYKDRVDKMTLVAPADGYIYYGSGGSDRRGRSYGSDIKEQLKPGSEIWTGQALMHIPDTSKMKVEVNVPEADISKISLDLPSLITVPALDDAMYTGKVSFKARAARPIRYWDPTSARVVTCEILIEEYDERLTPGSTVQAEIMVEQYEDVLKIPVEYVFDKNGEPVVYKKTGPRYQCVAQRIKLGKNNNEYVIVEEGLKEGDEVFQYAPPTAESAEVTGKVYTTTPPPLPSPGEKTENEGKEEGEEKAQPKKSGEKTKIDRESLKNMSKEDLQKLREKFKNRNKGNGGNKPKPAPKSD